MKNSIQNLLFFIIFHLSDQQIKCRLINYLNIITDWSCYMKQQNLLNAMKKEGNCTKTKSLTSVFYFNPVKQ